MPKRLRKPKQPDPNVSAFHVLQRIIAKTEDDPAPSNVVRIGARRKNPAAVALGRKGGLKSAAGRMKKIDPAERRRLASHAARMRWEKENGDD